jgi:hypothetical protein
MVGFNFFMLQSDLWLITIPIGMGYSGNRAQLHLQDGFRVFRVVTATLSKTRSNQFFVPDRVEILRGRIWVLCNQMHSGRKQSGSKPSGRTQDL